MPVRKERAEVNLQTVLQEQVAETVATMNNKMKNLEKHISGQTSEIMELQDKLKEILKIQAYAESGDHGEGERDDSSKRMLQDHPSCNGSGNGEVDTKEINPVENKKSKSDASLLTAKKESKLAPVPVTEGRPEASPSTSGSEKDGEFQLPPSVFQKIKRKERRNARCPSHEAFQSDASLPIAKKESKLASVRDKSGETKQANSRSVSPKESPEGAVANDRSSKSPVPVTEGRPEASPSTSGSVEDSEFQLPPSVFQKMKRKERRKARCPSREAFVYKVKGADANVIRRYCGDRDIEVRDITLVSGLESKYKSFRLETNALDFKIILNPEFWPEGVMVRRFWNPQQRCCC